MYNQKFEFTRKQLLLYLTSTIRSCSIY
ncbi:unnamed protein product [Lathyrus sativus]|nr:unnamed protein product [Lathyrus sativus]